VNDSAEIARIRKERRLTELSGPGGRVRAPRRASAAEPDSLNSPISVSATSRPSDGDAALITISNGSNAANACPASAIARSNTSISMQRSAHRCPRSTSGRSGSGVRSSRPGRSTRGIIAARGGMTITRRG